MEHKYDFQDGHSLYSGSFETISHLAEEARTVRIVHISDTHRKHWKYLNRVIDGDILIHSGDFDSRQDHNSFHHHMEDFNEYLGALPHRHKVFVAGNHEIAFNDYSKDEIQELLPNCVYLQDSGTELENLKLYGTPWTSSGNMGFSARGDELQKRWKSIPEDTHIVITHMPPFNMLDLAWTRNAPRGICKACSGEHYNYTHWGSKSLYERIIHVKPVAHLFGHVHDDTGSIVKHDILFQNAAMDLNRNVYFFDIEVIPGSGPQLKQDERVKNCIVV